VILEHEQGNVEAARAAYRQAIGTGHPEVAPRSSAALVELDENPSSSSPQDLAATPRIGW
jgi:hypothetical protein